LDTACSLALLQEEVAGDSSRREVKKTEFLPQIKNVGKSVSITNLTNSCSPASSDSRRVNDHSRTPNNLSSDSKISALMAYKKAKGLCYKCGMKWNPSHKCAASVPLHVVEELWQLVHDSEDENPLSQEY
jgi:hypothetical protein